MAGLGLHRESPAGFCACHSHGVPRPPPLRSELLSLRCSDWIPNASCSSAVLPSRVASNRSPSLLTPGSFGRPALPVAFQGFSRISVLRASRPMQGPITLCVRAGADDSVASFRLSLCACTSFGVVSVFLPLAFHRSRLITFPCVGSTPQFLVSQKSNTQSRKRRSRKQHVSRDVTYTACQPHEVIYN